MKNSEQDRQFYNSLVNEHADDLYRFAYRQCGKHEDAEDLVQETYYEAWKSIGSLRDPSRARAWLLQILRHRFMRLLRERSKRPSVVASTEETGIGVSVPGFDMELFGKQEMLQNALDKLDDRYKQPFLLVFLEGFSCREAADELEIPLGTVLSRLYRARNFLRKSLSDGSGDTNGNGTRGQRGEGKESSQWFKAGGWL